jgi:HK97 family phage portal protein
VTVDKQNFNLSSWLRNNEEKILAPLFDGSVDHSTKGFLGSGIEGSWRGPFYGQGELGHSFMLGPLEDGWQRNLHISQNAARNLPVIAAGRSGFRNAWALLIPQVLKVSGDTITKDTSSIAFKTLLNPNPYETGADFNARFIDQVLCHGEVLVYGVKNNRYETNALYIIPRPAWTPVIDNETGALFYDINLSMDDLREGMETIRVSHNDVIHFRWSCPRHPLIGEGPLAAAAISAGINVALSASQLAFFSQSRRPSGIISTDQSLNVEQMKRLREAFDNQAADLARGGIPILANGMKFQPMSLTSQDAQVLEAMNFSVEDLARCMCIPPQLVGHLKNANIANTEHLISHWLSIGLGGLIERYERQLERIFKMDGITTKINFDLSSLLRTDFAARMEAYGKGVMSGILSPNEVREKEGLTAKEGGDNLFLQRQQTPVSLLTDLAVSEIGAVAQGLANTVEPENALQEAGEKIDPEVSKALVVSMMEYKRKEAKAA